MPEISPDIVQAKPLAGYRLQISFEDGTEGVIDVASLVEFTGVFESLRDEEYFAQVRVDPDVGTVTWPNGADLDPDVLYSLVSGEPLPDLEVVSYQGSLE